MVRIKILHSVTRKHDLFPYVVHMFGFRRALSQQRGKSIDATRGGKMKSSTKIPPSSLHMRHNSIKQNLDPMDHSCPRRPWTPATPGIGTIFAGNDPFDLRKYRKAIKQGRVPAEYGRVSRPGSVGAPASKLYPHTTLPTILKRDCSPFLAYRRPPK